MAGPKEQPLPPDVIGREDATEVLRAFVVDGALGAELIGAFKMLIENPVMMMVSLSIGRSVRRSITSASMPSFASSSAALIA